jgi:hypothetical protein
VKELCYTHVVQDVGRCSIHHQLCDRRVAAVSIDGESENIAVVLEVAMEWNHDLRAIVDVLDLAAFNQSLHGLVTSLTARNVECVSSRLHEYAVARVPYLCHSDPRCYPKGTTQCHCGSCKLRDQAHCLLSTI